MVICRACGKHKRPEEFSWRVKNKVKRKDCKVCASKRINHHYQTHKEDYRRRNHERKRRLKELVNSYKKQPCADCGESYKFWIMHFDHLENSKKIDEISRMVANFASTTKIKREIAKCEVVCANCHADRTYKRILKKSRRH